MARPADPNAHSALIKAAVAEFTRRGIKGARIEDITSACGLSKGAFYLHFPSKEALFGEIVSGFVEKMREYTVARLERMQQFHDRYGALTPRDYAQHSRRYEAMIALEAELDLVPLELMWEYRDVLTIITRGAQGTEFEGLLWDVLQVEADRVAEQFRGSQAACGCRADLPPEIFGSLVVGTYFLIALQMSRANTRPDLRQMAESVQRLIREGSAPLHERHEVQPSPARGARPSPPSKSRRNP